MAPRRERRRNGAFTRALNKLKWHHKIMYAFLVFIGVVMTWYGMWNIVASAPFFHHPLVSLVTGLALLSLTGALYKHLS